MIKPLLLKLLNITLKPATRLAEAALSLWRGLPTGVSARMTPTNLSWDLFLRRRDGRHLRDLAALRVHGRPGLVSIVLPVHNGERYLGEALDSILAQTHDDFELIVVDDGSTDRTPEMIAAAARRDPRVRAVRQDNARLPAALNAGFALARGEFLTWTSDDNRLRPDFLARMVAALQADPRAEMIYADYDLIGETGELLQNSPVCARLQKPAGSGHVHLLRDISILNLIDGNYVGGAFLYRARAPLLVGGFSPWRFTCEDYDFALRVNEHLRLRHAPFADCVYEYRLHGGSLTAAKDTLAIDRKTGELMAFDDFRRDFIFHPLAWTVETDGTEESPAGRLARRLERRILAAGETLLAPGRFPAGKLPRNWFPAVSLRIADRLDPAPRPGEGSAGPATALRILVYAGSGPLPERLDPAWDLAAALGSHANPPRLAGARQGWLATDDFETLWIVLGIRARSDHAERLEALAARAAGESAPLRASVVISTTGRRAKLAAAVRSALRQTLPADAFEVIVVNNVPEREDLSDLLDEIRRAERPDAPDSLREVLCPLRGMSIARNAGLAEARGQVVHFLDDDALAAPGLLENLLRAYAEHPECAVMGGAITLKEPERWPSGLTERARKYWGHFDPSGSGVILAEDWRQFPWGGNWSARREVLLAIGGFRCRYGRGGRQFSTGEDVVASLTLQRLGYRIGVAPGARVTHDVDPSRFTARNLARTIFETWELTLPLELDFYLERPAHWPRLFWLGARHLRHALYALRKDRFEALENILFAVANVRLALRQLGVELHRWRRARQDDEGFR